MSHGSSDKNFNCRPPKGWLHNDQTILNEGVSFNVKYIGCIEIFTSMKMLDFQTRSLVAKECINRVCDTAAVKSQRKRRVEKRIMQSIADKPCMEHAGTDVTLNISSKCLTLTGIERGDVIAKHDMPRISFASGGDSDTLDFVAYVAKDLIEWRACYVLECGGGTAQTLISTIGQAFELRYNEFYLNENRKENSIRRKAQHSEFRTELDYYNDLPGKMPPDLGDEPKSGHSTVKHDRRDRLSSNLIDLNSPNVDHDYVNDDKNSSDSSSHHHGGAKGVMDVFDMQPFSLGASVQLSQLMTEKWYHGAITRAGSEALLRHDGDFLVRESHGTRGQWVLTGQQGNQPKHLLLVDPEGVVRTKDRIFESISHLINYHCQNLLPIISADSALLLRTPVCRSAHLTLHNNN